MTTTFPHGYALVIGVGQSAYAPWSLPATVKDAQAIRAALTDPARCAYPDDDTHIRLLHDASATRAAILEGLAWLADRATADPETTAIVYYSGHGWVDAAGAYYLIAHDIDPYDIAGSALAAQEFTAALRAIKAQRLLVIMDCCHAAGMATAKDAPALKLPPGLTAAALPKALVNELKHGAGRAVFTSSRGEQRSWMRPDGTLSIYTDHLIEALSGAGNRPGDTVVRISNLMNHLGQAVPASARAFGQEQIPFFDTATEDFAVAQLLGGKGLSAAGWSAPASPTSPAAAGINQSINNIASNQGAQGIFQGPVTFNFGASPGAAPASASSAKDLTPDEQIAQQQTRLDAERRRLADLLLQEATFGSAYAPPHVLDGIREARLNIRRIKQTLRDFGAKVIEHPDDERTQ